MAASGGKLLQGPRWTTVEAFLNDLPRTHCTVKPRDLFCTVCMRINHDVAFDCPLREVRQQRAAYEAPAAARPAEPEAYDPALGDSVPSDILAEGPVIEFAPSSEPPVKRRMKAKPLEKRGGLPATIAPPPPPSAGAAEAAPAAATTTDTEDLERELKAWDPEATAAGLTAQAPPVDKPSETQAPEKAAPAPESAEKRSRWRKR